MPLLHIFQGRHETAVLLLFSNNRHRLNAVFRVIFRHFPAKYLWSVDWKRWRFFGNK